MSAEYELKYITYAFWPFFKEVTFNQKNVGKRQHGKNHIYYLIYTSNVFEFFVEFFKFFEGEKVKFAR